MESAPVAGPSRADRRFGGKVALVTGAGHGIGRASAHRLGSEGARVAVLDMNLDAARETGEALATAGIDHLVVGADVAQPPEVTAAVQTVLGHFGRIDVLHNNAGRLRSASVVELSVEEWDLTFNVNVRSMFLMCQAVIPAMRSHGGGVIVNTASTSGLWGEPGIPAYNASKAAVINLTRQLAADYTRDGIRVNCVCPGWIPTGFNDPVLVGMDDREVETMVKTSVAIGRQGTPGEVAAAVAFLASDDASYVVGHALVVDGGQTACAL